MTTIAPAAPEIMEDLKRIDDDQIQNLDVSDANNLNRFNITEDDLMSITATNSESDSDEMENPQPAKIASAIGVQDHDQEIRGRPSACVFVASLSSNLSDDVLCQSVTTHFKQWGDVSLVKVLRDPANRPYAFVQYSTDDDANRAIMEGQHSILNGRTVRCEKARVNRTLYLQVPLPGMDQLKMKDLLNSFGEVERIVSVNDNFNIVESGDDLHTNWFAKFVYRQDAIGAFANLKTKASWNIEWAQNLEDEYSNVPEVTIDRFSIFVGHLDPRISKEELIERFEKHGKIKEAILVNRPLSNFAFIKFKTKDAAASAVERENHSMFKFKTIHVQYREMYNNYKRKYSNENGFKLNLAPPPVNFKRRNNSYERNGGSLKSVNFDLYDQTPKFQKRFNFNSVKKFKDRKYFNNNEHHHQHQFNQPIPEVETNELLSPTQPLVSSESHIEHINKVDDDDKLREIDDTVSSSKDADDETTRGNVYSAMPKSGYTYTTVDGGETEDYYPPATPSFQTPCHYYYYVPGKDFVPGKGNHQHHNHNQKMEMMIPPPLPMPPASNGGYYYPYPNYTHASVTGNQPPMYHHPYYFYYNPMGAPVEGNTLASGQNSVSMDFAYPSFKNNNNNMQDTTVRTADVE